MAKVITSAKDLAFRATNVSKVQLSRFSNPLKDVQRSDKKPTSWSEYFPSSVGLKIPIGEHEAFVFMRSNPVWQSLESSLRKFKSLRKRKGLSLGMLHLLGAKNAGGAGVGGHPGRSLQNFGVACGASAAVQRHGAMEWESLRIASFQDFPSSAVSALRLAAAGFLATGAGDEVECFSCHVRHGNWKRGDVPLQIHRQLRPACRFLTREIPGVPMQGEAILPQHPAYSLPGSTQDDESEQFHQSLHLTPESVTSAEEHGNTDDSTSSYGTDMAQDQGERTVFQPEQTANGGNELTGSLSYPEAQQQQQWQQNHQQQQQLGRGQQEQQQQQQEQQQQQQQEQQQQRHNSQQQRIHQHGQQQQQQTPLQQQQHQQHMQQGEHHHLQNQQQHHYHQQHQRGGLQRPSEGAEEEREGEASSTGAATLPREPTTSAEENQGQDQASRRENLQDLLNICVGRARYPQFALLLRRQESLSTWPGKNIQDIDTVAEAGFFYSGHGDGVRCFHCDGGLKSWQPSDDPWVEHARWFPRCNYLRQCKGDEFLTLVTELLHRDLSTKEFYAQFREKMNANRENGGRASAEETPDICEETRCKICLEKEVSIIFLPCGHLVSCPVCAPALAKCPVCRNTIHGTLKAYMS